VQKKSSLSAALQSNVLDQEDDATLSVQIIKQKNVRTPEASSTMSSNNRGSELLQFVQNSHLSLCQSRGISGVEQLIHAQTFDVVSNEIHWQVSDCPHHRRPYITVRVQSKPGNGTIKRHHVIAESGISNTQVHFVFTHIEVF
jgi:hypothetical protein